MALRSYKSMVEETIPVIKEEIKVRIPLSIAPNYNPENKKVSNVKALSFVSIFIIAPAIFAVFLNVGIAQTQYNIVSLKNQANALTQENESLHTESNYLNSPQVLSQKAHKLGMVSPTNTGVVNLTTGEFIQGEVAKKNAEKVVHFMALPDKPTTAAERKKSKEKVSKAIAAKKLELESKKIVESKAEVPAVAPPVPAVQPAPVVQPVERNNSNPAERPVFSPEVLNGGTIPAPTLKQPEN